MIWQILVLSLPERRKMLDQLIQLVATQMDALPLSQCEDVSMMIAYDDEFPSTWGVGDKREAFRRRASISADYISWIDDDDLPAADYVAATLAALREGPDIVGWEQQVWQDGRPMPERDLHTISTSGWFNSPGEFHRDISHQQPIRRTLALSQPMSGGSGEDARWAQAMRDAGDVQREVYLDRIMYYYLWRVARDDARDHATPWRVDLFNNLMAKAGERNSSGHRAVPID